MQGLTPTRRGNVPGSLSTYKQAFGGILIFMDAPCLPSLHCTHTDSYRQLQAESNELQQGPEPEKITLPHVHFYLLSQGTISSGILFKCRFFWTFRTPFRGSAPRSAELKH